MILILATILPVILAPYVVYKLYGSEMSVSRFKKMLAINLTAFGVVLAYSMVAMTTQVYAAEAITSQERGMAFLAAALVTGMCTIGTGVATGMAAQSALAAISENEALMGKSLIFVGLAEGIAIYGLLIAFTILGRV